MYIFYNGDIIEDAALNFGHDNRAFMYGDGLFETIIYQDNQIRFETYHKERLSAGMKAMNLMLPEDLSMKSIFSGINRLVQKSNLVSARIRLQVWRSPGGLYIPQSSRSQIMATCSSYTSHISIKSKVGVSKTVKLMESNWSAYKTVSAISYIQAGIEKEQRGLDDLILLDHAGYVSECSASNIFWKKGDIYYTPSLKTGCIGGIMRRHIIDQLNDKNIELNIGEYAMEKLLQADEIFTCNVTGIHPIISIDNQSFSKNLSITPLLAL